MSGWVETVVWRRFDIYCGCGYAMQARWENGQAKGFAVCTKCGDHRDLLTDGPPTILEAAGVPPDSETDGPSGEAQ